MSEDCPNKSVGGVLLQATAPCADSAEKELNMKTYKDSHYVRVTLRDRSKGIVIESEIHKDHLLDMVNAIFPGLFHPPPPNVVSLVSELFDGEEEEEEDG